MPVEPSRLAALVEDVGRFYVRDRVLRRAQDAMQILLTNEATLDDAAVRGYLLAVSAYFTSFDREARSRLRDLERRLAKASQLQFNLTAERGVAVRRIEATQGVLSRVAELAPR